MKNKINNKSLPGGFVQKEFSSDEVKDIMGSMNGDAMNTFTKFIIIYLCSYHVNPEHMKCCIEKVNDHHCFQFDTEKQVDHINIRNISKLYKNLDMYITTIYHDFNVEPIELLLGKFDDFVTHTDIQQNTHLISTRLFDELRKYNILFQFVQFLKMAQHTDIKTYIDDIIKLFEPDHKSLNYYLYALRELHLMKYGRTIKAYPDMKSELIDLLSDYYTLETFKMKIVDMICVNKNYVDIDNDTIELLKSQYNNYKKENKFVQDIIHLLKTIYLLLNHEIYQDLNETSSITKRIMDVISKYPDYQNPYLQKMFDVYNMVRSVDRTYNWIFVTVKTQNIETEYEFSLDVKEEDSEIDFVDFVKGINEKVVEILK